MSGFDWASARSGSILAPPSDLMPPAAVDVVDRHHRTRARLGAGIGDRPRHRMEDADLDRRRRARDVRQAHDAAREGQAARGTAGKEAPPAQGVPMSFLGHCCSSRWPRYLNVLAAILHRPERAESGYFSSCGAPGNRACARPHAAARPRSMRRITSSERAKTMAFQSSLSA